MGKVIFPLHQSTHTLYNLVRLFNKTANNDCLEMNAALNSFSVFRCSIAMTAPAKVLRLFASSSSKLDKKEDWRQIEAS